jgi:hypothetical protein
MPAKRKYSNQFLLDQLAACCERLGRSVTEKEFDADPETTVSGITIRKRFHGWNEALAEIGQDPTRHGRKPMDPEEIKSRLVATCERLGYVPTGSEFCRESGLSMGTIYRAFGTWNRALSQAGLTASERRANQRYSDVDLLLQLAAWISVKGTEPSFSEFSDAEGTASAQTIIDRFGSWAEAKRQAAQMLAMDLVSGDEQLQAA